MMFAKLSKLYVIVKWLPNKSVDAYFWIIFNEKFHMLMYKCIHKTIHHTWTPKILRVFTYESVWQSSNHHIQMFAKLVNHLQKPLMQVEFIARIEIEPRTLHHYGCILTGLSHSDAWVLTGWHGQQCATHVILVVGTQHGKKWVYHLHL